MASPSPAFARLVAPLGVKEFFSTYWERQPLHLRRDALDYYKDALTLNDVDRYFQSHHVSPEFLAILRDGDFRPQEQWVHTEYRGPSTTARQIVDMEKVLELFHAGATIIVNSGEIAIPSLTAFSRTLGSELKCRVQTNVYLTPRRTQGFPLHFDSHNVFILQIEGHKSWRLYDAPIDAPVRATPVDGVHYEKQEPRLSVELHPGDLLYIPRGIVHCARAEETPSIHVSVGPMLKHWSTLLRMLAEQADQDTAFRRLLPHGLSSAEEQQAFNETFKRQLEASLAQVDLSALHYAGFVKDQRTDGQSRLTDIFQIEQLTLDSVVCRRPSLHYLIDRNDQWIIVRFAEEQVNVPIFAAAALDTLLRDEPFAVREIPSIPNDSAKLALVRRFVQSGFLTIVTR